MYIYVGRHCQDGTDCPGELCLSPIGLSLVSQVAPVRLAAVMMGIWFAANAIANYLAGILESLLAGSSIP
jgi:POT family proton-dependent oligopeptide transporter